MTATMGFECLCQLPASMLALAPQAEATVASLLVCTGVENLLGAMGFGAVCKDELQFKVLKSHVCNGWQHPASVAVIDVQIAQLKSYPHLSL